MRERGEGGVYGDENLFPCVFHVLKNTDIEFIALDDTSRDNDGDIGGTTYFAIR